MNYCCRLLKSIVYGMWQFKTRVIYMNFYVNFVILVFYTEISY